MLDRRATLRLLLGAGLAMAWRLPAAGPRARRLVLIELKGGNDGLNTFPRLGDPLYRALRPTVALPDSAILPLGSGRGLHPAAEVLREVWEKGQFAVVDGVGSARPDLSHFWAGQQWETGEPENPTARSGWLASAMAANGMPAPGATGAHAVVFGFNGGPLLGSGVKLLQIDDASLEAEAAMPEPAAGQAVTPAQERLAEVLEEWRRSRSVIASPVSLPAPDGEFPAWNFSRQLQQLAGLMVQDPALRVFKLVVDGFDTHTDQVHASGIDQGRHYKLLRRFSRSLVAFVSILRKQGAWDDTVIAAYSEFGRRPRENGAHGTDHGTANSLFLLGGGVRGGFHGQLPSLEDLDANGNLRVAVDFRRYYNSLATEVLGYARAPYAVDRFAPLGLA